ncbi:hypothetical protein F4779DRAFT_617075 [Xylariaceae sp. FL0662B]|nr:hypothetical protein F4779DRAFT_617075 [Xylariaceae sp. FL0662B]
MAPPPATPTPHRFLVPKRSQSRAETPKAFQGGGQQFQATPRFSVHSTPRASGSHPSSTPAPAGAFHRPRDTDPINDIIDSSPPFADQPSDHQYESVERDIVPESSPVRESDYQDEDEETPGPPRAPKRRRISVSSNPSFAASSPPGSMGDHHHAQEEDGDLDIQSSPHRLTPSDIVPDEDIDIDIQSPASTDEDGGASPLAKTAAAAQQQPTFHKAPRFKPSEVPEGGSGGSYSAQPAPDAFSPHGRKGARYAAGGLAAEVRDWFVDVRAGVDAGVGAGARREADPVVRIRVEAVRGAPGMALVVGRVVGQDADAETETETVRIVLAGQPRVCGLARSPEVRPGVVVGVYRPTWEVALLEQGRWAVVCEWVVLG